MRHRKSNGTWRVGAFGLIALGLACNGTLGPDDELSERRAAWEAMALTDYDYTLRVVCYCLDEVTNPVRVEVRGDTITSLTYVQSGEAVDSLYHSVFLDVDGLFAKIRSALEEGADSVDARYHATQHFPTHIWIDYSRQTADEEIGYEASDLTALQASQSELKNAAFHDPRAAPDVGLAPAPEIEREPHGGRATPTPPSRMDAGALKER